MSEANIADERAKKPILLAILLIAVLVFVIVMAAVVISTTSISPGQINAASYRDEVAAALDGADESLGAELVASTDCANCHLLGDGRTAPLFDGVADVAAQRRPPLSAAQYLYEATLYPAAHLVEGYTNAMPNDYGERLSLAEVGHIIAHLLTLTAETGNS